MKFEDDSQNLRSRLRVIQIVVVLMITALGVRLYYLQIVKGPYYAERAENQRIRLLPIPAPRGVIFDRNDKLLVDSRPIYNVILSREDIKGKNFEELVKPYAKGLNVDREDLAVRFDQLKSQPAFESFTVKENASPADIAWVDAHTLEFPELRVELQPQRRYPSDGKLAHVLGYVGEISPEQLELPQYKEKGYKPGDIIGKEGLEKVYDDYLRGRDGYRKVIVDSRGHIQSEVERVEPQPGQDLVTTIDLDLQDTAEEQLRNSASGRGVIVVMDPNSGEILAMASYPTFDPNLFSQRITSKEGRAEYAALKADPKTPLINRAIQGRYPPGSTWKIPMSAAGLEQGAITVEDSHLACGGGITIGNKFTRCMNFHGVPELRYAITKSCDGYYYRLGLKMGVDGIIKMADEYEFSKRSGIDLPHELASQTPAYWKPALEKRKEEWKDIRTVYASIGQDTVVVTPIASLRAVSSIAVGGRLYVPHLFREARAVGEPGTDSYRPARTFDRPDPKIIPIPEDQHRLIIEGMWGVVNNGGTAARIKMAGFEIAGKTGTAQVVGLGKDVGDKKDHAWFVSFAPAYQPEISVIALIENVGFGGTHAAPAVRAIYDSYYRKTRHQEPPGSQLAQQQKPKQATAPQANNAALAAHR
ncbi:MAG TPA: penicillin-binding protein 2 [Pyrinomonadaceae bacterium]|nr:penicillin-binding protein 2 [Pyrinomonadaceae bacterium]